MIHDCNWTVSNIDLQKKIADYYIMMNDMVKDTWDELYAKEIYGDKAVEEYYNLFNDFNYLLGLLIIINCDMTNDENGGIIKTKKQYCDAYNIECQRKYFLCKGFHIKSLLAIFYL